jgi:serine/threonine protein kinase/membrane-associated protease RseP (regulator of RpoE activity)
MSTLGSSPAGGEPIHVMCPTCGAKYVLPEYKEGQRFGCKRCSASLLFGKFALMQELGRGGFGVVYKAWQADLHRTVALKFLQSDSEESTERFIREARIAANLAHPNITPIYEVGTHEGKLYITMLFVDGTTTNKSKFSIRESAQVIRDTALAVDFAHARNIIHRDIKPHNLMVTREEASGTNPGEMTRRVYVMDFGLARSVGKGGTLTTEGQILGTPAFMSPEQAEGKTLDSRSDIYSLGATLYSLVTHRAPFEANTPVQVLMLVATGTPTPPSQHNPDVDPNLEGIILKAMSRKVEDRYSTAGRMAQDLNRFLQGAVTDAGPTVHISSKSLPSTSAPRKKSRALPLAIGLLLILVGAAGLLKIVFAGRSNPPDPRSHESPDSGRRDPDSTPPVGPAPAKVVLRVRTEPSGARVKVGPLDPKESPCEFKDTELAIGEYDVTITRPTYEPRVVNHVKIGDGGVVDLAEKLVKAKRAVAFRLLTVPPGAKVELEGADIGQPTPISIYRDQIPADKDRVNVALELRNFERKSLVLEIQGSEHEETIVLEPVTGTLVVRGAAPHAKLHLFAFPEGLSPKNPRPLLSLWSENGDEIEKALMTMDPEDAPVVAERLRALGGHLEARIRDLASKLAVAKASSLPLRPEVSIGADGAGNALFDKAWVANRYRLLATAGSTSDFVSEEFQPIPRDATSIKVVMTAVASVSARVTPLAGHFLLKFGDGTQQLKIVPGAQAVRIPAGPITLRFVPPANDPLLCEFTLRITATDRVEIAGNLYLMAAQSIEKDDPVRAVRIYTKLLGEDNWPDSEIEERKRLPAKVTGMIRAEIARAEGKPADVADPAQALDVAAKKPPAEALGPLLEVWCAKNSPKGARGGAAAWLALNNARLKRPFEAIEWLERTVAVGMDPGPEIEAAVAAGIKNFPCLTDRFEPASRTLAGMRAPPPARKPGFLGVKLVEVIGRGVRVDGVAKGGPAEGAGLQFGDILVELGSAALKIPSDFDEAMKALAEGDEVELKFDRAGARKVAKVRLAPVPASVEYHTPPETPAKVGVLQAVLAQIGHIVKLDAGAEVKPGDALQIVRNGEVVAELQVTRTTKPDGSYPNGSAVCKPIRGVGLKGDEVRRKP